MGGRQLVGLGRGPRGGTLSGGARHRHGRLDPGTVVVLRCERAQADVRTSAPRRRLRGVLDAGPCGSDDPQRRRPWVDPGGDRGQMRHRPVRLDSTCAGLRSRRGVDRRNAHRLPGRMAGRGLLTGGGRRPVRRGRPTGATRLQDRDCPGPPRRAGRHHRLGHHGGGVRRPPRRQPAPHRRVHALRRLPARGRCPNQRLGLREGSASPEPGAAGPLHRVRTGGRPGHGSHTDLRAATRPPSSTTATSCGSTEWPATSFRSTSPAIPRWWCRSDSTRADPQPSRSSPRTTATPCACGSEQPCKGIQASDPASPDKRPLQAER